MSVYVDKSANLYRSARGRRMVMCHMIADTPDELHAMAIAVGLKRRWFQASPPASFPHYDVCRSKRALVVSAGAIDCDRNEFVAAVHRIRASKAFH